MAYGIAGELKQLRRQLDPTHRFIETAIRLVVCERASDHDRGIPTGEISRVFGGVWDKWEGCYTGEPPIRVLDRWVSKPQYDFCLDYTDLVMVKGGRGGGKSEGLAQKGECVALDRPGEDVLILSPDYPHTEIVFRKLKERIFPWLLPGQQGIKKALRQLCPVHGGILQFKSAYDPDKIRGFDASTGLLDEEKDISAESWDNFILCIRLGVPHIGSVGTPEAGGEYEERWLAAEADEDTSQMSFPSKSNPFIAQKIFDIAKKRMDAKRYQQEVLAEFVQMEEIPYICRREFSPAKHCIDPYDLATDITGRVTLKKTGKRRSYIAGVDYNFGPPNVAWIYKVYAPNNWVLHDIIHGVSDKTSAILGQNMTAAGYTGQNTLVVDDASGEWNRYGGKQSPNSSSRIMRRLGYTCIHKRKNPDVKDRVNSFLVKLSPVEGDPSWFYLKHLQDQVKSVMSTVRWHTGGNEISKTEGVDHDFDACTYPIVHFCPAAQIKQIQGVYAVA